MRFEAIYATCSCRQTRFILGKSSRSAKPEAFSGWREKDDDQGFHEAAFVDYTVFSADHECCAI
jgi:hypothetical protein